MLVDFRGLLIAAVLAAACVGPTYAQSAAETRVAEQARYWENRGRFDLAREAWQKLLQSDPENPAALAGLGGMEARAGRLGVAQQYLDQLSSSHPNHSGVRELQSAIAQSAVDQQRLNQARQLALAGTPLPTPHRGNRFGECWQELDPRADRGTEAFPS